MLLLYECSTIWKEPNVEIGTDFENLETKESTCKNMHSNLSIHMHALSL
jgi:hypothetical protein